MTGLLIFIVIMTLLDFLTLKKINPRFQYIYYAVFCLIGIGVALGADGNIGVYLGVFMIVYSIIMSGVVCFFLRKKKDGGTKRAS